MKIPITKPYFDNDDHKAIAEPLRSGWVTQGPCVEKFEQAVADYTSLPYAVATTSCTTALHLAILSVCGPLSSSDKIIIPSFTFIATANAVRYAGGTPLFCDINLDDYNIDVDQLRQLLEDCSNVVAIIPVSLFGHTAAMQRIQEIAKEHKVSVIEDAACAIGTLHNSHHAGYYADAACLSFHPRKSVTTGEGGMIITKSGSIAQKARELRNHGARQSDLARHESGVSLMPEYHEIGYNYRMTDIQGALGCSQMKKVSYLIDKRIELATRYYEGLADIPWLRLPPRQPPYRQFGDYSDRDTYQSFVTLFSPSSLDSLDDIEHLHKKRNLLMQQLSDQGIATRQGTHAVHLLDYYKHTYNLKPCDFPNSYIADRLTLALPLYPQMTHEALDHVCRCLLTEYERLG